MSKEQNQNPSDPKRTATPGSGGTPMSVSLHTYEITYTPQTCEDWSVGDKVDVYVTDPAQPVITLNPGDECDGSTAKLVS